MILKNLFRARRARALSNIPLLPNTLPTFVTPGSTVWPLVVKGDQVQPSAHFSAGEDGEPIGSDIHDDGPCSCIEGVQFTSGDYGLEIRFSDNPRWLDDAFAKRHIQPVFRHGEEHWVLRVFTPQGFFTAEVGDWIVHDAGGNLWVNYTPKEN